MLNAISMSLNRNTLYYLYMLQINTNIFTDLYQGYGLRICVNIKVHYVPALRFCMRRPCATSFHSSHTIHSSQHILEHYDFLTSTVPPNEKSGVEEYWWSGESLCALVDIQYVRF